MKNSLNRLIAGIACTVLIAGLSVLAHAAEVQPPMPKLTLLLRPKLSL